MYMKLLEQTIKELKGEDVEDEIRANLNLRVDLRIDDEFIPDTNQRLTVYRRFAAVRNDAELDRLMDEVRDRYGNPPASVLNLAEYAAIRLMADRLGIESADREAQTVVIKFRAEAKLDPQWLFKVVQERGDTTLVPPATMKLDMRAAPATARRAPVPATPARARKGRTDPVAGGLVVDCPRHGRPGHERLLPGRDSAPCQGGPAGRGRRLHESVGAAPRVERGRVAAVKYCVPET